MVAAALLPLLAAAPFAGQAQHLEGAPAEAVADRAGGDQPGLDPPRRQRDVGLRQEPAPPPKPVAGAIEAEAELAQHGPQQSGRDADQHQHRGTADREADSVGEQEVAKPALLEDRGPEPALERVDAKRVADRLAGTEQARQNRQAEIEEAQRQHPLQVHREQRRRVGFGGRRRRCGRGRRRPSAQPHRPHMLAQRLGAVEGDAVEHAFLLARRRAARLERHPRNPEHPLQRTLLDADVGHSVERDGALVAADDPAVDPDRIASHPEGEAPPVKEQAAQRHDGDPGEDHQRNADAPLDGDEAARRDSADDVADGAPDPAQQRERVQPLGRGVVSGHRKRGHLSRGPP